VDEIVTAVPDGPIIEADRRLRALLAEGRLALPLPGGGHTVDRLRGLSLLAATEDVSAARLAEAHCDAVAILAEAGHALPAGMLAGVWASRYAGTGLTGRLSGAGWHLSGVLEFCSGASIVDVALVDVDVSGGESDAPRQLFAVDVRQTGVTTDLNRWRTPALAATATGQVTVDLDVELDSAVGEPGFYLDRPGFWHGAIGVAACWAGAARGVYDGASKHVKVDNPHAAAHFGRAWTACWMLDAVIDRCGRDIDERPDTVDIGYALTVRDLVVSGCHQVMESAQRATGPGPMAFDSDHAQRLTDLRLYLEQHHHDVDLAEIGRRRAAAATERGTG